MWISFEGADGSGKTSQLETTYSYLKANTKGREIVKTREPGGSVVGSTIRRLVLDNELIPISATFMFLADRAQHIQEVIVPALKRNAIVLCDRSDISTVVYQGHAGNLDPYLIKDLCKYIPFKPDLTIWLKAPYDVLRERLTSRSSLDRYESETYQKKVVTGYELEMSRTDRKILTIDARQRKETVSKEIQEYLKNEGLCD